VQQRGVGRAHADLVELARHLEAGQVGVDQQQRDPAPRIVRRRVGGAHHHRDEVRPDPVGDVDLRAVDDPVVTVAARACADRADVRAGIGLGDADRGHLLAADGGREVGLLLLLGPELEDRWGGHVGLHADGHRDRAAVRAGELLGQHHGRPVVGASAAVLLGHREPEQPELTHPREDPVREVALALPVVGVGRELVLDEAADRRPKRLVLLAER
jgi:hypothetical protein